MWGIELNRQSELSLRRQIYKAMTDRMLSGHVKAGEKLPSTRELAHALSVSRNTVNEAYDLLIAEGFVISHQGAATRVADGLHIERDSQVKQPDQKTKPQSFIVNFQTGRPDLNAFPRYLWQRMAQKVFHEFKPEQLGYTGTQGLPELRSEIAAWLYRSKGLLVNTNDLFITAGSTHALHIIADLVCQKGKQFLIEDPCHSGIYHILQNKGCPIAPVPVDANGLQTDGLEGTNACAIYVTPSHQFPLGGILPAGRRAELIRFAGKSGTYIVEDDYDSEFRYLGEPITPLYAMNPDRVIHVGTFSKSLFPAIRIGYAVLPPTLHQRWRDLRKYTDVQNSFFDQAVLAEFLHTRKFDRHLRQMRKRYDQRRQTLLASLTAFFGRQWRPWGDASGLHLAAEFPGLRFDDSFINTCRQKGIYLTSVANHCIRDKKRHMNKLLLGYGHLEQDEIHRGISLLHDLVTKTIIRKG
ncbi:PLP-dependent aminotransferase family protein [Sporolactobacillus shoreicorticis]|uniref:PLP-dependent aminotransferase family protein n=1 Tax=Sporolactobacillus shoreicorticis TaxID=1923877 RepID=A0ABW5S1N0_9BACL|nr:PLP-dependent aminotransferase family protein [Sporolactobacillus shoreicorticis]MCO7125325.1 PLP-dependent aminotransferase family protein [Sporolactobacillus shoreicorticis]